MTQLAVGAWSLIGHWDLVIPIHAPVSTPRNPTARLAFLIMMSKFHNNLKTAVLPGLMAHELAHVKHRDILISSVAATIAGAISMLGYLAWFGGIGGDSRESRNGGLLALILGPLAAGLIQMAISRSREYNADNAGAE